MNLNTNYLQDEFHKIDKNRMKNVEITMQSPRSWSFTIKGKSEYRGYLTIPNEYPAIPPVIDFADNQITEEFYTFFKDQPWNSTHTILDVLISIRNYIHTFSPTHTKKLQIVKTNEENKKVVPLEDNKESIEVTSEEKCELTEKSEEVPDEGRIRFVLRPRSNMHLEAKASKKLFSSIKHPTMIVLNSNDSLLDLPNESIDNQIEPSLRQRDSQKNLVFNIEVRREEEKQIEVTNNQGPSEDRGGVVSNQLRENDQLENAPANQRKGIGEWWYEFRRNRLRNYSEQITQLRNNKTITCLLKTSTYIQTFYKALILKLGFSPIAIIVYFIISIICFFSTIVILFCILIKEDLNDICNILIVGNFISAMFLMFTLTSFIRQMANPIYKELSVFTVAIEVSARVAYDITGIFVMIYYLLDHEPSLYGIIFLTLFITYLCIWYKLEGLRLLISIIRFFLSILDEISVHTCCKPWKGVKANSTTYDPALQPPKCTICQDEFFNQDKLIALSCHITHAFHHECLLEWVKYKTECPCCKLLIDKTSHPSLLGVESNQQANL